jgi:putative colanic acid biosynthesis acetyltransferase WcaF
LPRKSSHDCDPSPQWVELSSYGNRWFQRGRAKWVEALWMLAQALLLSSWIPGAAHRRILLRAFGAKIGRGVDIKPGVRVKFPWRLSIGDNSWIGENVWIDNLAQVDIGSNCCISQGAYLCTGTHDWTRSTFDLVVKPISVGPCAWLAAKSVVAPGVNIGIGAVLGLGSVATGDLAPWTIYQGAPAAPTRARSRDLGSSLQSPGRHG